MTPQSIGALFDPSLWTRDETGKFPPLTLHILPNLLKPGEELRLFYLILLLLSNFLAD